MNGETLIAVIGGLSGLIGVIITSLRKREDDTVAELRRKLERAEQERDAAESRADAYQMATLSQRRTIYHLRSALADHNIPDPTVDAATGDTLH